MAEEPDDRHGSSSENVEHQQSQPIYTSYKTPELNGNSKPPIVSVPGTLKPFSHTIPVDKISPVKDEVLVSTAQAADVSKINKPVVTKGQGMIPNMERIVEFETFVKDASEEPASTTPFAEVMIDDEKVLKLTTTEAMAEILRPDFVGNREKVVVAEEPVVGPSKNTTILKVSLSRKVE